MCKPLPYHFVVLACSGSVVTIGPGGQHYVPVDCMLGRLRELRLSISSAQRPGRDGDEGIVAEQPA